MVSDSDAVIIGRYTGTSREFPETAARPTSPVPARFERLGEFEILEVLKPHEAIPATGARVEIVVPGSYQEFPTYILHTYDYGVDEPVAEHRYAIGRSIRVRLIWKPSQLVVESRATKAGLIDHGSSGVSREVQRKLLQRRVRWLLRIELCAHGRTLARDDLHAA